MLLGAFLVAQLVKNPPATQETLVQFLGWEDLLEKGMATHSSILAWRIHCTVHGVTKSQMQNFPVLFRSSHLSVQGKLVFPIGWCHG